MKELPKVYDPRDVESRIYQMWMDGGCFKAKPDPDKKPFSIVMPPPNVTGQLHMGHALDCTLQDILTRFKRMQGYEALWLPGTDHAGIATQIKVEEELRTKEGLTRYDLGREKFLERVWAWKEKYGDRIVEQQKKMGASCDWDRSRFTMDEGCSRAVRETFCELYDKGLIYKGSRIINWCPNCLTALSDAEVEYVDKPGHLWHIRYPLADGSGDIVVATTRPETMMGDTGVAVNPEDEKFKHLIGKTCILPIMNREIPIVGDEYCEIGFGTGAVKMTPAHDPNDFEVGLRHNLEVIRVIADDGTINENGGKYNGMDRYECRKAIVADLEAEGYLVKAEPYSHNVGTCYRCHNDVEPLISAQWFVKMAPLAKEAIRVVEDGTAIGNGLATAINRLRESNAKSKVIILLTDGENNRGEIAPLTAAEIARDQGIRVYTIGVGTRGTAPYPTVDFFGNPTVVQAKVQIDEKILGEIADLTGGRYFRATDNAKLQSIYDEINQLEKSKVEISQYTTYTEEYLRWAAAALALLLVEFLLRTLWLKSLP